jgi:hypothetical protein
MTDNLKISDEQLVSYADGELLPEEITAIESALRENPNLRTKVDNYKKSQVILKTAFSLDGEKTPDHILAQIDAMDNQDKELTQEKKGLSFIENIFSYIQLQYAIPTAAAFSFGILLSPSLLPPSSDISLKGVGGTQIASRGSNTTSPAAELAFSDLSTYLNATIIQDGRSIPKDGFIQSGEPFAVSLLSPVSGIATIQESVGDGEPNTLTTEEVASNRYVTFPTMVVDDQSSLTLLIRFDSENIQVTQTLSFNVQN